MKNLLKSLGIGIAILTAFIIFTSLVAATDFYLSKVIVDLLYAWGLITALGHSFFGFVISLLLILPSYFFWLCAITLSYSFICDKLNVPIRYSIPV